MGDILIVENNRYFGINFPITISIYLVFYKFYRCVEVAARIGDANKHIIDWHFSCIYFSEKFLEFSNQYSTLRATKALIPDL